MWAFLIAIAVGLRCVAEFAEPLPRQRNWLSNSPNLSGQSGSATVSSVLLRSEENAPVTGHYGWISLVMPAFWRLFAGGLMER